MKIILALLLLTATAPSWAVGTMIVMAYYGLQTVGMMSALQVAAAFAINYGVSTIVSRVFSKNLPRPINNGVRTQVPPASTNSIPIVYGDAYLGGTFVDAVLSTNQQAMWYVMAISQVSPNGQFTFDKTKFYYGDRLITFDATEPAKVVSLTDGAGNVDTKIADNLYIYLYRSTEAGVITNLDLNGNAPGSGLPTTIMSTANGVPSGSEWNSTNRQMNGLAFAIVKLIYSQDDEAVALQQITFKCKQALNGTGVAKPGDVWFDYMTNAKYGGDIPSSLVDSASATALNAYADQTITFTDYNGNPATQPRYRINGVLDTGVPVLENIDKILMAADSWMAYDAPTGDWSIVINKAETTAIAFDDSNLVGDIRVSTVDINQAINQIDARFPNKENKDIPAFVFLETPAGLLYPNEPTNKYEVSFDLVNDSVQTQYLANRILEQAREDLIVTIRTTYAGIQINAGDVVSITNTAYGWNAKLFRVLKVNEVAMSDGQLGASLDLNEYNAQVYDDKPITQFTPAPNTGIPNPSYFSALSAPTVTTQLPNAAVPNFGVLCTLPATGRITKVLLFYTNVASPQSTDWKLLGFQQLTDGSVFINGSSFLFEHISLPTDTYYFAFQVANEISQSSLSPASSSYAWSPNPTSTNVASTFLPAFSPQVLQIPYAYGAANFTGIQPQLYATAGGNAVDYVAAPDDASALFVNNSWRIGASSSSGLGDIVKTNITIGNPTDGGFYALFPQPTAMAANPATIEVPVRYKDATGTVYQSINAICQLVWAVAGNDGISGDKNAIAYLYQWSTATPSNPNGTSTWTWATATNSSYTGTNGWATSIPANPGTAGIRLWTASKGITASASATTTSVNWGTGFAISDITQNGAAGASGVQVADPTVYQWAITIPAAPTGTSTYTWSSNSFTPTPAGWSLTSGTSPSPGYTLWAAKVNLVDSATVTTSTINWSTSTISAVGYSGTNGTNGTNGTAGASSRICFQRVPNNPTPTAGNITTSGSASFPTAAQSNATWGINLAWVASDPNPSSTDSLYQSDGIYNPTTGNTVWSTPYISSLKVGTLSAITVNTGALTVQNTLTINASGKIIGGQTGYNTGTGFFLGYDSSAYKFSIGNSSGARMLWTGSALQIAQAAISGTAITGGTIGIGTGATPSSYAFEVTSAGVVHADNIFTAKAALFSNQSDTVTGVGACWATTYKNIEAVVGVTAAVNANTSAHAVRGNNANKGTAGIIGQAGTYDFYADGSGTNYGPFTGTHDSLVSIGSTFVVGDIVVDGAVIEKNGVSSTITQVFTSTSPNQQNVLGVCCLEPIPLSDMFPAVFIESFDPITNQPIMKPSYYAACEIYNFMPVNSIGEGQINVCNEGGDIAAGDLICTSSIPGKGMKQADNVVRSITVAKAREAVSFANNTEVKMIACIYVSG
jgi:hypothetical protein